MDNTSQDAKLDSMSEEEIRAQFAKEIEAQIAQLPEGALDDPEEPVVAEVAKELENVEIVDEDKSTPEEKAAAAAIGWKDDPANVDPNKTFVSAKEFLARKDLVHEKNKFEKETKELRDKLKALEEKVHLVESKTINDSVEALNKQRLEAMSVGDTDAFIEADKKYQELIAKKPEPIKEVEETPPEAKAFAERNSSWFNDDPVNAHLVAIAELADKELVKYPHFSKEQAYNYIENRVKEVFPDKFKEKKPVAAVNPVEAKHTASPSAKEKRYIDLSFEEKDVYSKIKELDANYTVEQFLDDLKPHVHKRIV